MAEQSKAMKVMEEQRYQASLLEKVLRESKRERAAAQELYRLKQYEEVIRLNRELRQKQYEEQQKAAFMESLERDRLMLEEAKEATKHKVALALKEGQAAERERRREKRAATADGCEHLLMAILDLVEAAHRECERNDWKSLPAPVAREHLAAFAQGRKPLIIEEAVKYRQAVDEQLAEEEAAAQATPEARVEAAREANDDLWKYLVESSSAYHRAIGEFQAGKYDRGMVLGDAAQELSAASTQTPSEASQLGQQTTFNVFAAVEDVLSTVGEMQAELQAVVTADVAHDKSGRPLLNFLASTVRAILRSLPENQPPKTKDISEDIATAVPLRVIVTGPPQAGKKTLVRKLASAYGLQIIDPDVALRRALKLAGRLPEGMRDDDLAVGFNFIDPVAAAKPAPGKKPAAGKKGAQEVEEPAEPTECEVALAQLGEEIDDLLCEGGEVSEALYAKLIHLEIRHRLVDWPRLAPVPAVDQKQLAKNLAAAQKAAQKKGSEGAVNEDEFFDRDTRRAALLAAEGVADLPAGWVLVGFPLTVAQYRALEEELSGFVDPSLRPALPWKEKFSAACEKLGLLDHPGFEVGDEKEQLVGGANVHFRIEAPLEEIARRALGKRWDPVENKEVQIKNFTAPKEPLAFERLVELDASEAPAATVTVRATAFLAAQEEVDKFLAPFVRSSKVPASAWAAAHRRSLALKNGGEEVSELEPHVGMLGAPFPRASVPQADGSVAPEDEEEVAVLPRLSHLDGSGLKDEMGVFADAAVWVDHALEAEFMIRSLRLMNESFEKIEREAAVLAAAEEERKLRSEFPEDEEDEEQAEGEGEETKQEQEDAASAAGTGARRMSVNTADGTGEALATLIPVPAFEQSLLSNLSKLSELIREGLFSSWTEIQSSVSTATAAAMLLHVNLRSEVQRGVRVMKEEMQELLHVPDQRAALVDAFIVDANRIIANYQHAIESNAALKGKEPCHDELHLRLAELSDALFELTNDKQAFAAQRRQQLLSAGWVEARLQDLAVVYQRLANTELERAQREDQLLRDAVSCARGRGVTAPEVIVSLGDVIASKYAPTTANSPDSDAEGKIAIRIWEGPGANPLERAEADELPPVGLWTFPFVQDVFWTAVQRLAPVAGWHAAASVPGDASQGAELEPALLQARVELRARTLFNLCRLRSWATRACYDLVHATDSLFNLLDSWITAQVVAENEAGAQLEQLIASRIEQDLPLDRLLEISTGHTQVRSLSGEVLVDPPAELEQLPLLIGSLPVKPE